MRFRRTMNLIGRYLARRERKRAPVDPPLANWSDRDLPPAVGSGIGRGAQAEGQGGSQGSRTGTAGRPRDAPEGEPVNRLHAQRCPDCGRPYECRGLFCRHLSAAVCDECMAPPPPVERERLADLKGTVPGCYRRLPAPPAE